MYVSVHTISCVCVCVRGRLSRAVSHHVAPPHQVEGRHAQLKADYTAAQERLAAAQEQTERILAAVGQLDAMVTDENRA